MSQWLLLSPVRNCRAVLRCAQHALQLCSQVVPLPLCFELIHLRPIKLALQPAHFLQGTAEQQPKV
jgi:hypothetical protein